MGRPPLGKVAMTSAERYRRWQERHRQTKSEDGAERGAMMVEIDWPNPSDWERDRKAFESFGRMLRKLREPDRPRRARRLSFAQARKQGGSIASVTDHRDGSRTFTFGQSTTAADAKVSEWDLEYGAPSLPPLRS